jgi:hypothetical protein
MKESPEYITPPNYKCSNCGELCKIIPLRNEFDFAGTHCTNGLDGTHYPVNWGDPVSDCCEAPILKEGQNNDEALMEAIKAC